jgi:hypothetical protein
MESALYAFLDVDGAGGTKLLARPYDADFVRKIPVRYFKMTCKDRLDQLTDLPQEHKDLVASMFETIGCAPIDVTPFFEILRWFGLSGFTFRGFLESVDALSLNRGTTSLALAIMDESKADILLSSPVKSVVRDSKHLTNITTRDGKRFLTPRVICTLPVNCLGDVTFDPPISPLKLAAAKEQHLTKVVKMHTYTAETLIPTFTSTLSPAKIAFGYTESDVHDPKEGGGTFSVFSARNQISIVHPPSQLSANSRRYCRKSSRMRRGTPDSTRRRCFGMTGRMTSLQKDGSCIFANAE